MLIEPLLVYPFYVRKFPASFATTSRVSLLQFFVVYFYFTSKVEAPYLRYYTWFYTPGMSMEVLLQN